MSDNDETRPEVPEFDFSAFPEDTLFHDRRTNRPRRSQEREGEAAEKPPIVVERRAKKERRRRIDPTTFEKQYTKDELEFMNAMQRFKDQTGRPFLSHREVLRIALSLGYRKAGGGVEESKGGEVALPADTEAPAPHHSLTLT
jgi:hypothetical protein